MFGLRSAEQVGDVELVLLPQRGEEIGLQRRKMLRRHGHVGLAPPDGGFGFRVPDDELVARRPAGMLAGLDDQRAVLGQNAFAIGRSEEHTSELQSLMRISYAVFCLKK